MVKDKGSAEAAEVEDAEVVACDNDVSTWVEVDWPARSGTAEEHAADSATPHDIRAHSFHMQETYPSKRGQLDQHTRNPRPSYKPAPHS